VSKKDIGIDLGTANTLIYQKSKGIVLDEPSVVAVDSSSGKIISVGKEAKEMLGRTPSGIVAVKPVANGVISDFDAAGAMLSSFIKRIFNSTFMPKPRAIVSVPASITNVERRATVDATLKSGVSSVKLVEEPMAAAIGAGLSVEAPSGVMVVDIGSGTTEIAVISLGGIVSDKCIRIGGDALDNAISSYIRRKYGVFSGKHNAEEIKLRIGTVMKHCSSHRCQVTGRNAGTGLPCSTYVTGDDIRSAVLPEIYSIVDAVKSVLEDTPPELSGDLLLSGITLTGGGSNINGLDRLLASITGMPVKVADEPLECVAKGLGSMLSSGKLFEKT